MVDSLDAYNDHYRRGGLQHPLKLRRLFTLKADPARSFQPQDANQRLIDIVPYLSKLGVPIDVLRQGLRAGFVAKQFRLTIYTERLYSWLNQDAAIKLTGEALETIRKQNTQLASP